MNRTPLSLAVAFAVLAPNAHAAATTMYNLYNNFGATPCAPCIGPGNGVGGFTDGWVWGGPDPESFAGGTSGGNPSAATPGWVGTAGPTTTPFGYVAGASLNWAIDFGSASTSAEISNADALARYGVSADIDTAKGAWLDNAATPVGWLHDLDIGLFRAQVTQTVRLSVQGVNFTEASFGITVFKGMNTNQAGYIHHGSWNNNQNGTPVPTQFSFAAGDIVATTDTSGTTAVNLSMLEFVAEANQVYTVFVGGWRDGDWYDTRDGYVLSAQTVPLPAAAWLFGLSLGALGFQHRRRH